MKRLKGMLGRATIGPLAFGATGLTLFALKFVLDRLVAGAMGRDWPIWNYLIPGQTYSLLTLLPSERNFLLVMLGVALPFILIGLLLTVRRLRDAGLPIWMSVLFFVPLINLLLFAMLSVAPSRGPDAAPSIMPAPSGPVPAIPVQGDAVERPLRYGTDAERPGHRFWNWLLPRQSSLWRAALLPVPFTLVLMVTAVTIISEYGWGIFVGLPFALGVVAPVLHGYAAPRNLAESLAAAGLCAGFTTIGLLIFAIEGAICIIMLMPLAVPIVFVGALVGHAIQARPAARPAAPATLWAMLLALPVICGAESLLPRTATIYSATTTIEVDAPPQIVWQHVVRFSDIAPPDEWIFQTGIAYPVRARIEGTGVGATRYCEFSTGAFVEPIETWDEPTLLAFSVTHNPPPMDEWSPFDIDPPHLENFLIAHRGQFHLVGLPGGRTRLEGTTWYQHGLWPEPYWRLWSDMIIHSIHGRVLEHVARESEQDARAGSPHVGS